MLNLNDREWKAFFICDIFALESTSSGIDGNKITEKNGDIPYLTRTDTNNGYKSFIGVQDDKWVQDVGNCITIGLDTQTAFYQPHSFYTGQNVQVLRNAKLNRYNAKFFIPLLHNAMVSLNWGGNGATLGRLKKKKIVVPITADGTPDYAFMEQYIKEREYQLIQKYNDYISNNTQIGGGSTLTLENREWKAFYIGDIFDNFIAGKSKGLNHLSKSNNGVAYIGATNTNNGVMCFVDSDLNIIQDGNAVGFIKNGNGSAGYSIYKSEKFIATSDVIFAYAKWLNRYIGLFITTCSDMSQEKYSHGYKWTKERLVKSSIMLPITPEGTPDYAFMENYAKMIMLQKYQQFLNYINA